MIFYICPDANINIEKLYLYFDIYSDLLPDWEEVDEFIKTGVFDFWEPPLNIQRIKLTVDSIAEGWRSPKDNLKNYSEYLDRLD